MSWLMALCLLWLGFILGYLTCAVLSWAADSALWSGEDRE